MKQRLVILGAGQMGRAAEALLDWNEFCLCAFGDNFSGAWDPAARPPVLPVKEALSATPDLVLLGVLDEARSGQLERQARSLGYRGAFLRLRDLYRCFDMRGAVLRRMVERLQAVPGDMAELEKCLKEAQAQRFRIICTDGVFSMDGNVAPMDEICDLAEKYDALVMVDESHSAGVVGATGHGVSELKDTYGRVDIYTGTLGKAFGGALGGFTTGRKEIIDMLRQSSRPYLFSNSLAPSIIGASLEVFKMLKEGNSLHDKLVENVTYFRDKMLAAGFDIKPTQSAICAVMLYDAPLSQKYAAKLLDEGIYVTGFYYPVVPKGEARIRVQLSAAHAREQLDKCINAFIKIGKELDVLK